MSEGGFAARLVLDSDPVSAVDLALFAAASGDHNPLHLDAEVARSAGFERPVVHGMLTMARVARLFTATFGADRVRALETRFAGVAMLGDAIRVEAALEGVRDGCADYSISAHTGDGRELVAGHARVAPGQRQ